MLERVDLAQIHAAASRQQSRVRQIYAETVLRAEAVFRERRPQMRWSTEGSLLLETEALESGARRTFVTSQSSTRALLEAMNDPAAAAEPRTSSPLPAEWAYRKWDARLQLLTQIARAVWPEDPRLCHCELSFRSEIKHFEIGREGAAVSRASEESATLRIEWKVKSGNEKKSFRAEVLRYDADQLLAEIAANNFLAREVERSLVTTAPWPAPQGELPVYWSPRAVAKLTQAFLRAFEADRVLHQASFLSQLPPGLELPFALEDSPPVGCDHEGSATQPRLLFDGSRVRSLLVDKNLAEAMSVPPTGHCRRERLLKRPEVGFWRVKLSGQATLDDLKPRLEWGLSVRDLEILSFDPATGETSLKLSNAVLLHHGEEGETIEPLEFTITLLQIFHSWKWFSAREAVTGLAQTKGDSEFLTEVTCPAALSERLALPGQVPTAHYW